MRQKLQQCSMAAIYLNWAIVGAGAALFLLRSGWPAAVAWTAVAPLSVWGYIRVFPRISRHLGYGAVTDEPARSVPPAAPRRVTLYTALGCPFCPILRDRLRLLSGEWGFELEEIDVTAHPELLRAKEIRAVPVVEVDGRTHVGFATTRHLADLILAGRAPADPVPARVA